MTEQSRPASAYIHVPFCRHRCGYCNFTLVAGRDDLAPQYLSALEKELSALSAPQPVETLFLGGGTPTHLSPADLEKLLALVARWHPLLPGGEFSVEANPADINPQRIAILAAAGVTRISLGAQSFQAEKLQLLERDHQAGDIARAVELCRPHFHSISLDLIFAVPQETSAGWMDDLAQALALKPQHISTYGLTFERGTSFWSRRGSGELQQQPEAMEAGMYEQAIDRLTQCGFEHYEVSNFALPGFRCRHNEVYWTGRPYFAAGPGAARYVNGRREVNHRSTTTWMRRVLAGASPVAESETLAPEDVARELFVFGLRRMEGVRRDEFQERTGYDADSLFGDSLQKQLALGLLMEEGPFIRLTRRGLLLSDAIWPEFLRV